VPSPRIARVECVPVKLTEDAFAVIKFFFMVKPTSEDVCTCPRGGGFSGITLVAWGSEYGETDMLVRCLEDGTTTVGCCLTVVTVIGIWDNKLVVATAVCFCVILSGARLCLEKGFFDASELHPLWKVNKMGTRQLML